MQTSKKKPSMVFLLLGAVLAGYLGYLIGGAWEEGIELMEFMDRFSVVCETPFANYFNENSVKCIHENDKLTNKLKKSLNEAADRLEKRCEEIKQQLFEVKESIKNKASDIMADFKMRGKEALNRVSEFVGLKEKLTGIRDKVKEGIADTNRILAKIDAFGKGMREATQQMANTFRTFADKEEVDYSQKEKKFSKTELAKKPWQWQKKVHESMVLHLDASIDKVEDLSRDVELNRMKDKQMEEPNVDYSKDILPVGAVAEPSEYQYGAEAFEAAYPKMKQEKVMDVKTPTVSKTGKIR